MVKRSDGTVLQTQATTPRDRSADQDADTPWDEVHVAYFSGEALWTYLNSPFLYTQPRFANEEIAPVQVEGETWRRSR